MPDSSEPNREGSPPLEDLSDWSRAQSWKLHTIDRLERFRRDPVAILLTAPSITLYGKQGSSWWTYSNIISFSRGNPSHIFGFDANGKKVWSRNASDSLEFTCGLELHSNPEEVVSYSDQQIGDSDEVEFTAYPEKQLSDILLDAESCHLSEESTLAWRSLGVIGESDTTIPNKTSLSADWIPLTVTPKVREPTSWTTDTVCVRGVLGTLKYWEEGKQKTWMEDNADLARSEKQTPQTVKIWMGLKTFPTPVSKAASDEVVSDPTNAEVSSPVHERIVGPKNKSD